MEHVNQTHENHALCWAKRLLHVRFNACGQTNSQAERLKLISQGDYLFDQCAENHTENVTETSFSSLL